MGYQRKFNRNRRRAERRLERKSQNRRQGAPPPFDFEWTTDSPDPGFGFGMDLDKLEPAPFVGFVSSFLAIVELEGASDKAIRQFIDTVGQDSSPSGHALLIGVAAMAPRADDRVHARRLLGERSQAEGDLLPDWITGIDQAVAVRAFVHHEAYWDSSYIAIELQLGEQPLCILGDIGHVERYVVTKGHLYPGTIEDFLAEFPEVLMTDGTSTEYLDLGRAGAQLAEAVRRADEVDIRELLMPDEWQPMRAELLWAARLAGAAELFEAPEATDHGVDPLFDPETAAATPAQVAEVIDEFRRSSHGLAASAGGVDEGIDLIATYGTTAGHGRLESWGPRRAALFLHLHVLGEVWEDDVDLSKLPLLLEHWIRFIHERADVPEAMAKETIERIHEATPLYRALLRARDQSVRDTAADFVAARMWD